MSLVARTIDNGALTDFDLAMDAVAGKDYQYTKVVWGSDGVATVVDAANGLPIQLAGAVVADMDSGAGTASRLAFGLLVPASGGPALVPGDATYGMKVQIANMPPATKETDGIGSARMTTYIMIPGTPNVVAQVKFFKANVAASSTDSALITAVGGKKLRIITFRLHAGATATVATFNSKPGGAGTAITEAFALGANGGRSEQINEFGHFETVSGEGLSLTTGAGSTVGVGGSYIEV